MHQDLTLFVARLRTLAEQPLPSVTKQLNHQALFAALLSNQLLAQVGATASTQARQAIQQYFEAVLLCRQQQLLGAQHALSRADASLLALPAVAVEVATLFQLSAWGNYYYANQEGDRAVVALRQGLILSAKLERRGYTALIHRRIEQLQNVATIYFQQQQPAEAGQLLRNALSFVVTGQVQDLLIEDWEASGLRQVPALHEHTLRGLLAYVATRLGTPASSPFDDDYRRFFQDLLRKFTADTYNQVVLYNWLFISISYLEEGLRGFLHNVGEFLADAEITASYDMFKVNLLQQVLVASAAYPGYPAVAEAAQAFAARRLRDHAGRPVKLAA